MSSSNLKVTRTLLLLSLLALPLLTLTEAENRHLIPDKEKEQISDFYRYLRSRYGKAPEQRAGSEAARTDKDRNDRSRSSDLDRGEAKQGYQPNESPTGQTEAKQDNPSIRDEDGKADPKRSDGRNEGPEVKPKHEKQPQKALPVKKTTPPLADQAKQSVEAAESVLSESETELAMADQIDLPEPIGRRSFAKPAPAFYRGLYINNALVRGKNFEQFMKTAKQHGINVLVIDIQPTLPSAQTIELAENMGFYLVARVVVFDGGLKTYPAPKAHLARVTNRAEEGAKLGFAEIQFDYIRFADNLRVRGLTMQKRYAHLSEMLSLFERRLRPYKVRIGADIFGRIAFNRDDIIGQKLEVFDRHIDVIYPMLYPSHFYGDPIRRKKPYQTIFDGTIGSRQRVKNSRIVPYIQAFGMKVGESGLTVENYIRAQLDGARDSGGAGYVAWNARNDYSVFFRAIRAGRFMPVRKR